LADALPACGEELAGGGIDGGALVELLPALHRHLPWRTGARTSPRLSGDVGLGGCVCCELGMQQPTCAGWVGADRLKSAEVASNDGKDQHLGCRVAA
jgi:hypothetical protein